MFLGPTDWKILDLFSVFRLNKCVYLVIWKPVLLPRRRDEVYVNGGGEYQITKLYKQVGKQTKIQETRSSLGSARWLPKVLD